MSERMRLQVNTEIPVNEGFAQEWDSLVLKMESPQVFYTYEWARAVSQAYTLAGPLLFAGYRGGALVGVASLAVDTTGEASFLAGTTADYCDFVSAPEHREEFISTVIDELRARGIENLTLANLPADSASAGVLKSCCRRAGFFLYSRPAYFCARVPLKSPEQRQRVVRSAHRNSKKTKNALSRLGTVSLDHTKTFAEFASEFPDFTTANVERFLAAGRFSNLISPERRTFLVELAKLVMARQWLTLSTLRLDGNAIAWQLGFQFAGSWLWYLPAFDSDFQHLHPGPGTYLAYQIFNDAAQDPSVKAIDLGLGDEGYKQQYATEGRQTLHVVASRSNYRVLRQFCRYRAAHELKRRPRLEASVRACRAWILDICGSTSDKNVSAFVRGCLRKIREKLAASSESIFMEMDASRPGSASNFEIVPLSTKLLARVALEHSNDGKCLDCVMACALRLRTMRMNGVAVLDAEHLPVHISWFADAADFPGLQNTNNLPVFLRHAVVLSHSWTSASQPNNSCYFTAAVASNILRSGRTPWVFTDRPHMPTFEALGFRPRFVMVRRKKILFERFSRLEFTDASQPFAGLDPAA